MSWPTGPLAEQPATKIRRIYSAEGMEALADAHPVFSQHDLLVTHIFPKLSWEATLAVERTCKKWRLWWRLHFVPITLPFAGPRAYVNEWILNDLVYNDGRDFYAYMHKDMTVYFDGFPLLFKED